MLLLIFAAAAASAQPAPVHESVAISDSIIGSLINPAVLSYGNGTGFGYLQGYDSDGLNSDFSLLINSENIGYAYNEENTAGKHFINISFPLYDNFYFGSSLITEDFTRDTAEWKLGILIRPADMISVGHTAFIPQSGEVMYKSGLAVRPLVFSADLIRKLTLFADVPWDTGGADSPTIGLHFEPIEGLQTRFGYDLENDSLGFSFSLALGTVRGGSFFKTDDSGAFENGRGFVQFSPKLFTYPYALSKDVYYDYGFGEEIAETGQAFRTGRFYFVIETNTVLEVLEELKKIENAPHVDGIVFRDQHARMSFSTMLEIKEALDRIREKGKKIVFYSDYMTRLEYLLAASCADALYLHPQGVIDLRGMAISSPYFKDFFNKYGIDVVKYQTGEYKTAYNFLSESAMPEAEREALNFFIEGLESEMALLIREGRGTKLQNSAEQTIAEGPYLLAEKALQAGLVDGLIQEDELKDTVPFFQNDTGIKERIPLELVRTDWSEPFASQVAVIHAIGPIITGEGMPGSSIGAESTAASIKEAREDDRIQAIILRINSGGGSALASDMIAREVELCRSGKNAKPVIVSMTGTAASGGYYISAFADKIVSSPVAVTGSIGVFALFPNISGLLDQYQIKWDVVKNSPTADFGAVYRPLTPEEGETVEEFINDTYERFLKVVSDGRNQPVEEVEKSAAGRIWTGRQAVDRGLVDEIGGYNEAFKVAAEAAGIKGEIELIDYTYADKWGIISIGRLPEMAEAFFRSDTELTLRNQLPPELSYLYDYYSAAGSEQNSYGLLLMPYYIEGLTAY